MEYIFLAICIFILIMLYSISVSLGIIAEELAEKEK